jgi:hypothetical protein
MTEKYPTLLHRWFEEVWNQQRDVTIEDTVVEATRSPYAAG